MTSTEAPIQYLRLRVTARPPRAAIVLPGTDDDLKWIGRLFIGVSRIWGGASFVVFPRSWRERPIWRRLLQAYDPDRVVLLARTFRGEHISYDERERRREKLREEAERWATRDGFDVEQTLQALEREQDRPYDEFFSDEEVEWLKEACAPLDHVAMPWLSLGTSPGYEFNDLAEWNTSDLPPLQLLRASTRSKFLDLLVKSRVGGVDEEYWTAELGHERSPGEHSVDRSDLALLLKYCWLGGIDSRDVEFRHSVQRAQDLPETTPAWFSNEFSENTPMRRSLLGCTWLYPRIVRPEGPALVAVIGDTAEDFCLYHVLRNTVGEAVWLPPTWTRDSGGLATASRSAFSSVLANSRRGGQREVLFTSMSMSLPRVRRAGRRLVGAWESLTSWEAIDPNELPDPEASPFVADADIWEVTRWAPFLDGAQGDEIETPIPDVVRRHAPDNGSWHVDVAIDRHQYPVRGVLKELLSEGQSGFNVHNIRPSKAGTSYWSEGAFRFTGQPLRTQIIKPRLRIPSAIEVFSKLLSGSELACRFSDKGQYTANAISMWGGLESLARDLSRQGSRAALEAYMSTKRSGEDPGVWLQDRRRYLTIWDLRKVSRMDRDHARDWVDDLVAKEILTRGMVLRCQHCRHAGWYEATLVGRTFRCRRCRSTQIVNAQNWKKPSEPMWHYELAEVVFQALRSDAREVVLALNSLSEASKRAFHYEPQMELISGDRVMSEIDIWAIQDGQIVLGEAKTGNRLGSNSDEERSVAMKLHRAARACTADRVLLATTARTGWRTASRAVVDEIFLGSQIAVEWESSLGS